MRINNSAFVNQAAVVTGASQGIGRAIALELAAQGAEVCLVARTQKTLEVVACTIHAAGGRAHSYCADLAEDEAVHALATRLRQDFGHVDILVHSAGIIAHGRTENALVADFDRQYLANVHAPYLLTQTLRPLLRPRRGQIVFINSSVGLTAKANVGQFAATQHALKAIADSLRDEVNPEGVRVLNVYPGRTATPRQSLIFEVEGKPYHPERLMQPEDVAAVVINALSLPWTAEVTDIKIRPFLKFD